MRMPGILAVSVFSIAAGLASQIMTMPPDPAQIPEYEVRATMFRVQTILKGQGFNVDGFADMPAPIARVIDCETSIELKHCLRAGAYLFQKHEIAISAREPDGCHVVTLAYELARYAANTRGITKAFADAQPQTIAGGMLAMLRETELAKAVAAVVAEQDLLPNCVASAHPAAFPELRQTVGD